MSETKEALPTQGQFKKLSECKTLQEAFQTKDLRDRIAAAAPKHLDPDNMLRAFIQACTKTPLIYKCDFRQSLGQFMSLAFLGLRPGTALGHAHLIPFARNKRINGVWQVIGYDLQVIIGYEGYEQLAYSSGFLKSLRTGVYLPADEWQEVDGTELRIAHRRNLEVDQSNATPKAVYAIAELTSGGIVPEIMPWVDVIRIRNRSQAYRRALAAKEAAEAKKERVPLTWTEAPWVRDERQMGRKTVIRRISHYLPMCPELRAAVAWEEQQEAGKKLDFGPIIDGEATPVDGIREVSDEEDGGVDPGAAFTDRREPPKDDKLRTTRKKPEPKKEPKAPEFEAVLVDGYGDVAGEYTDAVAFARAYVELHDRDKEGRAAMAEHNEDTLASLRSIPAAWAIIETMHEAREEAEDGAEEGDPRDGDEQQEDPPITYAAIQPPMNGGKPSWPAWLTALRDELATVPSENLVAWCGAQREVLAQSPMAQRALAIKAINARLTDARASVPWLADLMTAKAEDPDERWIEKQIAELTPLKGEEGRATFDAIVGATAVRTKMANLKRDKPTLYKRIVDAFEAKHKELPSAKGT